MLTDIALGQLEDISGIEACREVADIVQLSKLTQYD
jgi:hypothetical protein